MNIGKLKEGAQFGWRLARILRQSPPSVDTAWAQLASDLKTRSSRFLELLDQAVWSIPSSPYRKLFAVAGVEPGDVRQLVEQADVEGALERLRDVGVYLTSEEWAGRTPIKRGSITFDVCPEEFFNPLLPADYFGSTGASRSRGTPVANSFAYMKSAQRRKAVRWSAWDVMGVPSAVWFPVLPSSAGFNSVISLAAMRQPLERWFSQVDPAVRDIADEKRIANRLLPYVARVAGTHIPRPELATPADPSSVLDWCIDALNRRGRAFLGGYTSSVVSLAQAARERNHNLTGLVVAASGEPMTQAKASVLASVNITPVDSYAFMQVGGVATSCLHRSLEDLHVWDTDVAVITSDAVRPDGQPVTLFLWTTLLPTARSIFVNASNDDYGILRRDRGKCPCSLGAIGFRTTIGHIRGVSKVVAGGVTVPSDILHDLVDRQLPCEFGGTPVNYQFVEIEVAGRTSLVLRVDPALEIDELTVLDVVRTRLRRSEPGMLADEVWEAGVDLRIERCTPIPTRSGKILTLETLKP